MDLQGVFLIAAADLLLAASFVFQKLYGKKEGSAVLAGTVFLWSTGVVKTVFFAILCAVCGGSRVDFFAPFSLALAAGKEFLCLVYTLIGFLLLAKGGMTLYTLFLMTGGMTLPYLYGVLFLQEDLTVLRSVGLVLIILSTVLYNAASGQQKRVSGCVWLLCGAVFVLNGFVSILSKMHQVETVFPTAGTFGFAFWSALSGVLLTSILGVVLYRKHGKAALCEAFGRKTDARFVWGVSACAACAGGFSYLLQLFGAELLPATVLYPAVTGGSILCSALADKLFFKTRLTPLQWFGLLLAVAGTCLFL